MPDIAMTGEAARPSLGRRFLTARSGPNVCRVMPDIARAQPSNVQLASSRRSRHRRSAVTSVRSFAPAMLARNLTA
jgi:hypothetical protein